MGKFLLKLVLNGIIAIPLLLWFSDATFLEAAVSAVILCVIAYAIGDRFILPATNNTVATIADFGLTYVYFWVVGSFLFWNLTLGEVFWIALGIAVVEIWFHTTLYEDRRRAYR
jgi:hypothetical protein